MNRMLSLVFDSSNCTHCFTISLETNTVSEAETFTAKPTVKFNVRHTSTNWFAPN